MNSLIPTHVLYVKLSRANRVDTVVYRGKQSNIKKVFRRFAKCGINPQIELVTNDVITRLEIVEVDASLKEPLVTVQHGNHRFVVNATFLADAMLYGSVNKGIIKGKFRWVIHNSSHILMCVKSKLYNEIVNTGAVEEYAGSKLKISQLTPGLIYTNRYGEWHLYLGKLKCTNKTWPIFIRQKTSRYMPIVAHDRWEPACHSRNDHRGNFIVPMGFVDRLVTLYFAIDSLSPTELEACRNTTLAMTQAVGVHRGTVWR